MRRTTDEVLHLGHRSAVRSGARDFDRSAGFLMPDGMTLLILLLVLAFLFGGGGFYM